MAAADTVSSTKEVFIKKLNLNKIPPYARPSTWSETGGATYLIVGPSGSGKTRIIENIIFNKREFIPITIAISESESFNKQFEKIISPLFIYESKSNELLTNINNRQLIAKDNIFNPWMCVIFDDCMNQQKNFNSDLEIELFKTSRHKFQVNLISCQYSIDLSPALRTNCAGYFIMRHDNLDNRKKIYQMFAGCIPDFNLFTQIMDECTNNYGCVFIDNRSTSQNWQDKIFWFRASDLQQLYPGWKACSLDVQKFAQDRYDTTYDPIKKLLQRSNIY